ncbi:serine O-acetyltransferase [Ideonella aquatica]
MLIRRIAGHMLGGSGSVLENYLSLPRWAKTRGMVKLSRLLVLRMQRKLGVFISENAVIPKGTKFPHPVAIVIGDGVVLGQGVTIYQGVTLGGARLGDYAEGNYPVIGSNVTIFAGAIVVGRVNIGDGVTIGANAVVLTDITEYSVAVGAPARCILTNKD